MSAASDAFRAHLERDVTTTCTCWRLTRRDGRVQLFTDHDRPLTVDSGTFQPDSGFAATEARDRLGLGTDTVDIDGALSSLDISEDDLARGAYDGAQVDTLLVNWASPDQWVLLRRGVIGKITRRDGRFTAEILSSTQALDRVSGRYIRRACDAQLGDGRCRFDLNQAGFRADGLLRAAEGGDALIVSGLDTFEAGWFSHGTLIWTSGANAGRQEHVLNHLRRLDGVVLTLWREGSVTCLPGDAFTLAAGCDKRFETCKGKFGNGANFRGFPHLPGNDAAYGYVTEGVTFDGAPVVP